MFPKANTIGQTKSHSRKWLSDNVKRLNDQRALRLDSFLPLMNCIGIFIAVQASATTRIAHARKIDAAKQYMKTSNIPPP